MTSHIIPNKTPGAGYTSYEDGPPRSFAAMLRIDPLDNMLIGGETICKYLAISSLNTLKRWVELYAFPAIKRPDGLWMSSMTAIDQWIFLAAEVTNENTDTSRVLNVGAELALERLQHQVDNPQEFTHRRRNSALRAARGVGLAHGRKDPSRPYKSAFRDRGHRDRHTEGPLTPLVPEAPDDNS